MDVAVLERFLSFEHCRKFHLFCKLAALNGSAGYAKPYTTYHNL